MILKTQQFLFGNRKFEVLSVNTGSDNLYECREISKNKIHWIRASKFAELRSENKINLL